MVDVGGLVDRMLDKKLIAIEDKLRNSFGAIKQNDERIRSIIESLVGRLDDSDKDKAGDAEAKREIFERLKLCEKEISEMRKEISSKDIKDKIRKEISLEIREYFSKSSDKQKKELKSLDKDNTKRLEKKFKKYKEKTENLKREFIMFKNEFVILREHLDDWKKDIGSELKEALKEGDRKQEFSIRDVKNQINSLKARNTILNKELNLLKGRNPKAPVKEVKKGKKKAKKKGFLSNLVDRLIDE